MLLLVFLDDSEQGSVYSVVPLLMHKKTEQEEVVGA